MLIDSLLRGLDVVRRDRQDTVDSEIGCRLTQVNRFRGAVASRTRKDLGLLGLVPDDADDAYVLLVAERRRFSRGSAGNECRNTVLLLEVHQSSQSFLIDRAVVLERRDECCGCSFKHDHSSS